MFSWLFTFDVWYCVTYINQFLTRQMEWSLKLPLNFSPLIYYYCILIATTRLNDKNSINGSPGKRREIRVHTVRAIPKKEILLQLPTVSTSLIERFIRKGYFTWYDIILVTIHLRWILIFTVHYMFFCLNCCTYAVCVGNCTYHYHVIFLLYLFSTNVFSLLMYVTGGVPVFLLSKHAWVCFVISNSCGWCVLPLASSSFGFHALRARKWRDNTNILGASYDISLYPAEIANIVKEGVWWIPRHIIVWWRVTAMRQE